MRKGLGAVLFVLPIFVIVALTIVAKARRPHGVPPEWRPSTEVNPEYRNALSNWAASAFVPLDSQLLDIVGSIVEIKDQVELTQEQERELKSAVANLLRAFNTGDFDDYVKFRRPIGDYAYNKRVLNWLQEELRKLDPNGAVNASSDPAATVRAYWDKCFGGAAFSNYWQGIGPKESRILIESRDSQAAKLAFHALSNYNAGVVTFPPTVTFGITAEQVLREDKSVTYATVSLLIRSRPPDPPHPFDCRFFWAKKYSRWLPVEFVSSYTGPRKVDIVF